MRIAQPKVRLCCQAMHAGQVIAYPTEAVWGLGCDPFNESAVFKILRLKHRHWSKGLILIAGDISQFDFILHDIPTDQRKKLEQSWPGHVTWLVPHKGRVPPWVTGHHDTVALRVSAHQGVAHLCNAYGGPIVSTSANPQGLPPARSKMQVRRYFSNLVKYAPGVVGKAASPSTIKHLSNNTVLRP